MSTRDPISGPLLQLQLREVGYDRRKPAVLRGLSLEVNAGEIVGLVGQSGSGKTTLGLSILRLLPRHCAIDGNINFRGRDLLSLREREMRALRGAEIGLVLQNPLAALNPALRIGTQFTEAWRAHTPKGRPEEIEQHILATLQDVSLPPDRDFLRRYPRSLSVGMAQRVLIAMAILHRPPLVIADEPTSALDALTQADILALFAQLNRQRGTAMLYISHDLLSVASLCHRVAILHQGQIAEQGPTAAIFHRPQHPYTRQLLAALPRIPAPASATDVSTLLDAVHGHDYPAPVEPRTAAVSQNELAPPP